MRTDLFIIALGIGMVVVGALAIPDNRLMGIAIILMGMAFALNKIPRLPGGRIGK